MGKVEGVDAFNWHKVWLARGSIHRKLAERARGDPLLYDKARKDYERVVAIHPFNAEHVARARRYLDQLDVLRLQHGRCRESELTPGAKRRRLSNPSPEKIG